MFTSKSRFETPSSSMLSTASTDLIISNCWAGVMARLGGRLIETKNDSLLSLSYCRSKEVKTTKHNAVIHQANCFLAKTHLEEATSQKFCTS